MHRHYISHTALKQNREGMTLKVSPHKRADRALGQKRDRKSEREKKVSGNVFFILDSEGKNSREVEEESQVSYSHCVSGLLGISRRDS